ncbi:MAG: tetratricopeptide repeat protein [Bacteroidetes bacterium]|nr:tetratricopeptide repeat protein [Bacteroidota bacterium]
MSAKKTDTKAASNANASKSGGLESQLDRLQKPLTYIGLALIVVVGGLYLYKEFIQKPNEEKALNSIFMAQEYFEQGNFNAALNGDGQNFGLLDIANKYSGTSQGNLSNLYAGIAYMHMATVTDSSGNRNTGYYDDAIKHLKKFSTSSEFMGAIANARLGDCYSELGDYSQAISYYEKAANRAKNEFSTPSYLHKLGLACLETANYSKASSAFGTLLEEYPNSDEGRQAKQYKALADAKTAN